MQKIKLPHFLQLLAIISIMQFADSKIAKGIGNVAVQNQTITESGQGKIKLIFNGTSKNISKLQNRRGEGRGRQTMVLTDQQAEQLLGEFPDVQFSVVGSKNSFLRRRGSSDSDGRPKKPPINQSENFFENLVQFSEKIRIPNPGPLYLPGRKPPSENQSIRQRRRGNSSNALTVEAILGLGKATKSPQQSPLQASNLKKIIHKRNSQGNSSSQLLITNKNKVQRDGRDHRSSNIFQSQPLKRSQSFSKGQGVGQENPTALFQEKAVGLFLKGFSILTQILALAEHDGVAYIWQTGHSKHNLIEPVNPIGKGKPSNGEQKQKQIERLLRRLRSQIEGKVINQFIYLGGLKGNDLRISEGEDEILKKLVKAVHTLEHLVKVFATGSIQCRTLTYYFPKVYTAGRQTSRQIGVLTQWRIEEREKLQQSQTNLRMMRLLTTCLDVEGQIYSVAIDKIIGKIKFTKLDRGYLKNSSDRVQKYLQFGSQGNQYFKLIRSQLRFHRFMDYLKKAQVATMRLMVYGIKHMNICGFDSNLPK